MCALYHVNCATSESIHTEYTHIFFYLSPTSSQFNMHIGRYFLLKLFVIIAVPILLLNGLVAGVVLLSIAYREQLGSAGLICVIIATVLLFGFSIYKYAIMMKRYTPMVREYNRQQLAAGRPERMILWNVQINNQTYHGWVSGSYMNFWGDDSQTVTDTNTACAICLVDLSPRGGAGRSACCSQQMHKDCAEKYFESIGRIQCPLCRKEY
jgi:hypothetical protein